ncbi:uncharacterized protein LOC114311590 [Camellia sinensis]|uniref:uncharacterized protein LOC114311590 n=1 Tax=Camellia sinensis TaxID=4442 RepID=UPI00103609BC|nr:uncharacterized protein LOC114311590 [Camellia sinensis]
MEDERDWGPKPFKFLNAWLLHSQFTSFVENTWKELQIQGTAGVTLLRKLQALKMVLKQWNKEVYGNTAAQLKASEDELNALDLRAEVRPLEDAEIKQKSEARNEMWRLSRMLEWEWLQKSRLDWNMKGDRNTRYFHVMATSRQNRNALNSIVVGEVAIEEPNPVKIEVWSHFTNQFSEEWRLRPVIGREFKSVRQSDSFHILESEFSVEEVWEAVKDCNGNKAPGPDGFNLLFFLEILEGAQRRYDALFRRFSCQGQIG